MLPNQVTTKKSLRILCADDNTVLGDVMTRFFTTAGHTVEHVAGGLEAWDRLSGDIGHFDVLVTDNEMPGLNGLELVELLRQTDYRGRIIVHSGSLSPKAVAAYRALGVDSIVAKTTLAAELLGIVESFYAA
jgi:two-component system OmpR family response regulator